MKRYFSTLYQAFDNVSDDSFRPYAAAFLLLIGAIAVACTAIFGTAMLWSIHPLLVLLIVVPAAGLVLRRAYLWTTEKVR